MVESAEGEDWRGKVGEVGVEEGGPGGGGGHGEVAEGRNGRGCDCWNCRVRCWFLLDAGC